MFRKFRTPSISLKFINFKIMKPFKMFHNTIWLFLYIIWTFSRNHTICNKIYLYIFKIRCLLLLLNKCLKLNLINKTLLLFNAFIKLKTLLYLPEISLLKRHVLLLIEKFRLFKKCVSYFYLVRWCRRYWITASNRIFFLLDYIATAHRSLW